MEKDPENQWPEKNEEFEKKLNIEKLHIKLSGKEVQQIYFQPTGVNLF